MDLENLNCPQYVRFSSESFQASLDYGSSLSMDSLNQTSLVEEDLSLVCQDLNSLESSNFSMEQQTMEDSFTSTENNFEVHTNVTRSQSKKRRKNVTVPKPFHFETDTRVKNLNLDADIANKEKDFTSQLRHCDVHYSKISRVTKVKPFNLTKSKKKEAEGEYLPLAEQINTYQKKTPERYHSSVQKEYQPQEHWSPRKLRARTPKLQAVKRSRPVTAISREEQEAKEIEEMKAFEFHARPIDPRVYKPDCIEKPHTKKVTKPKDIELQTSHRAKTNHSLIEPENEYKFQARPVPKRILAGPTGLGQKPDVSVTVPHTPKFSIEKRLLKRKVLEQSTKDSSAKKVKIVEPVKNKPLKRPKPLKPKRTEIQPFSFDKIDQERFALKEKKIQEEIEKENKPFIFKAQLLPFPEPSQLPQIEKKSITKPKPFNFCLDQRVLRHSLPFEEENASFKAQPATVLHKQPFIPEKPPKPLIEFQEFSLQTDRRASERLKLKEQKTAEEQIKEQLLLQLKAKEEMEEQLEIQRLRQELVHKANPIPVYKPLEIKHSSKPLTAPVSPKFETDRRLRSRNESRIEH